MDYSFVPRIGRSAFTPGELLQLRRAAVRGSHCSAILEEALLDREHDDAAIRAAVARLRDDFVLTSFPTAALAAANLLVRSEFLILAHCGGGRLAPATTGACIERSRATILARAPRALIYRLCDYNPSELAFLDDRGLSCRGAERLLADPALLELDLRTVDALLEGGFPVDILVPYVRFPEQMPRLAERVRQHYAGRARAPRHIGMMLELPANLYEVAAYGSADFFVFGPGDLLHWFYGGLSRDSPAFQQVRCELLLEPVQRALGALDCIGGKRVFLTKQLVELASRLDLPRLERTEVRRIYLPGQLGGAR